MNQGFITIALLGLSAGLIALTGFCLYGYRALSRQLAQLTSDEEEATSLSKDLPQTQPADRIYASLREQPERREHFQLDTPVPAAAANTTTRAQVLRLHRSGESNASIASALGISQGEVKLMVKVQELMAEARA